MVKMLKNDNQSQPGGQTQLFQIQGDQQNTVRGEEEDQENIDQQNHEVVLQNLEQDDQGTQRSLNVVQSLIIKQQEAYKIYEDRKLA
eukprot:403359720